MVGNYGWGVLPIQEVQKVAILDIRINNCDRNEENILIRKYIFNSRFIDPKTQKLKLVFIPIDHGLSFPDVFETFSYDLVS